jgi:uncharacterized protein with NRDE domain
VCLLVIAIDAHPRLPLIVAGNRDEFHARPTQEAHWWPDHPDIVGGRDLQAGGTWLAMSRSGRFAAVTNYRDAKHETDDLRSRGHLITDFLTGEMASLDYLDSIDGSQYAGFNLLVADGTDAAYLSNRGAAMRNLAPGVYGLSNATLDDAWTKVTRSRSRLQALIADDAVDEMNLFHLLSDREKGSADEVEANDLSFSTAFALTAPFIVLPEYGTRCSTILTRDREGEVRFVERRFDEQGRTSGESGFSFESAAERGN